MSGTYGGTLGRSTSGGNLLLGQGQQGQVQGQSSNFVGGVSSSGGVVSSSTAGGTVAIGSGSNSGAYIQQQRSTNYLTESRGSGVSGASGVSGMSRG